MLQSIIWVSAINMCMTENITRKKIRLRSVHAWSSARQGCVDILGLISQHIMTHDHADDVISETWHVVWKSIGIWRIHRLIIEEHIMSPNTKVLVLAHKNSSLLQKGVKATTRRLKLRCNIEYVNIIKLEYFYLFVLNVRFYHEGIKYHMINAQFVLTIVRFRWHSQLSLQVRMLLCCIK